MTFTIEFGWWLVPLAITVTAFSIARFNSRKQGRPVGDYGAIGGAMVDLFYYGSALIVSLLSWLVWAILI